MGTKASDLFASLTRQQWNTYLSTFVPIENQMLEYAQSPSTVTNAVASARQDVATSFDQQGAMTNRQMRGLGLELNTDEQKAADRSTALARSLADVNAGNQVARQVRDRQQGILGNPSPGMGQQQPIV